MDDGVDYTHPDLMHNYVCRNPLVQNTLTQVFVVQNAAASYDFSSNDQYPYPRYTDDWFNR